MANAEKMAPEDLLWSYKGVLYPATHCSVETFQALESFEARSDDVLLVGYPKTGTNWLIHNLRDLVTRSTKKNEEMSNSMKQDEEIAEFTYLEFGDPGKFQRIKKLPSRRVLATHVFPHMLPTSIFKNNVKILVLIRNPKDIAVSYFHFSNSMPSLPSFKTWDEFFNAFLNGKVSWGSYFDHAVEWNKHFDDENIMFIIYEELKENLILGVKKIAKFFGFSMTDEEIQTVAERSSFQTMKENAHKTYGAFGNILFRKGTNWVGQILTDLVRTSAENNEDETNSLKDEELEEFPYLEVGDIEKYQRMEKLPSRRVIFTHLLPHNLPESIFKNKAKILVLVRNPKDVATSFYHFTNGLSPLPSYETWDEFFTDFMTGKMPWGSYFDYICEWSKHVDSENVMTITYEELKENRELGVKKIAEFFGLSLTEEQLQVVADKSSFQAMKENAHKTHGALGNVLFRKGGVSDWKNLFNEDQNREMDKMFEERLARTKLGGKMKYEVYCKA